MFHVMLVLPILIVALIFLAVLAGLLIGAVAMISAAIIGGTSVAVFVKNKTVKKFLLLGFGILFFGGNIWIYPILSVFDKLPSTLSVVISGIAALLSSALSIWGIVVSLKLEKKGVRIALTVIFSTALATILTVFSTILFLFLAT